MLFNRSKPWLDEGGQGLSEYTLIISLVAIALVVVMTFFGTQLKDTYCSITLQLPFIVDQSTPCTKPIVTPTVHSRSPNHINLEAIVRDPDGDPDNPYGAIAKVEFYMDSTEESPVQIEYQYRYCLGAGDNPCQDYYIGDLSPGGHAVIIKVYDDDGNIGMARFEFTR